MFLTLLVSYLLVVVVVEVRLVKPNDNSENVAYETNGLSAFNFLCHHLPIFNINPAAKMALLGLRVAS